jgi:hypothetical protein
MKNQLTIAFIIIALASCKKETVQPATSSTTTTSTTADSFDPASAILLKQGTLTGIGHNANGVVKIYDASGNKVVYFETFLSQDGPDLKVYLSKDIDAKEYIRLGVLKSTSGMQSYNVPLTIDASTYSYVHIWCERYSVVFARAEMK